MNKTKRLTQMGLLTAAALIIFVLEAQLPDFIPIPGIKPGLANIITLVAIYLLCRRDAFIILLLRIVLGSMFTGNASALLYSLSGGIVCFTVMSLLTLVSKENQVWAVSISGAIAHNMAQLCVAALVMHSAAVFGYLPYLIISAVITGAFTGICAYFSIPLLKRKL